MPEERDLPCSSWKPHMWYHRDMRIGLKRQVVGLARKESWQACLHVKSQKKSGFTCSDQKVLLRSDIGSKDISRTFEVKSSCRAEEHACLFDGVIIGCWQRISSWCQFGFSTFPFFSPALLFLFSFRHFSTESLGLGLSVLLEKWWSIDSQDAGRRGGCQSHQSRLITMSRVIKKAQWWSHTQSQQQRTHHSDNGSLWQPVTAKTHHCNSPSLWQPVSTTTRQCHNFLLWQPVTITTSHCTHHCNKVSVQQPLTVTTSHDDNP